VVPDGEIPPAGALQALARKYARLAAWRERREGDGQLAARDDLRTLATEFPGCLRELDTLGAPELARRATVCAAAATDSLAAEPWMAWIDGYHALVRRALAARDARARGAPPTEDAFERDALSPPGGRMGVVVMRALAVRFGVPASTIAAALFPVRRPSPYAL
jgi:hypothetical protein